MEVPTSDGRGGSREQRFVPSPGVTSETAQSLLT